MLVLTSTSFVCEKKGMEDSEKPRTSYAFNIRTDAALGVRIQKEAERRGESASFVFREAVREYLARIEKLTQEG